jgi:hypothetical protein
MVTVIGSVGHRNTEPVNQFSIRHFELQTSVYDPSHPQPPEFSIYCFFPHGKRWENTPIPNTGSYVSITAKVVGHVTVKNCLAVRLLDMSFIQFAPTSLPTPTQSTPTKRANRWNRRVDSTTPSKKIRQSTPEEDPITPSASTLQTLEPKLEQRLSATTPGDASSNHQSPALTPIEDDGSSVDLTTAGPVGRPQRNRRPTTKMR